MKVGAYQAALDVCDRPLPQDPYSAKFSLQHCVAAALSDGFVVQSSFDADARARLAADRAKVEVGLAAAVDAAYPASWGTQLDVETTDGRRFSAARRDAKGDPENPVNAAEMTAKARTVLADGGIGQNRAEALIAAILALPDDAPVRSLALFPQAKAGATPGMNDV